MKENDLNYLDQNDLDADTPVIPLINASMLGLIRHFDFTPPQNKILIEIADCIKNAPDIKKITELIRSYNRLSIVKFGNSEIEFIKRYLDPLALWDVDSIMQKVNAQFPRESPLIDGIEYEKPLDLNRMVSEVQHNSPSGESQKQRER